MSPERHAGGPIKAANTRYHGKQSFNPVKTSHNSVLDRNFRMTQPAFENTDTPRGLAFAIAAYLMWGFLPLYMKALSHMPQLKLLPTG